MAFDRRILIADDDPEVLLGASELMHALGLAVLRAGDGDQALALFRSSGPVHLALLDVHMPQRGGLELFQIMRSEAPELPCIFWSGDATEAIERTALRAGASAFLHKPVKPEVLRGEVCRVLDHFWS